MKIEMRDEEAQALRAALNLAEGILKMGGNYSAASAVMMASWLLTPDPAEAAPSATAEGRRRGRPPGSTKKPEEKQPELPTGTTPAPEAK